MPDFPKEVKLFRTALREGSVPNIDTSESFKDYRARLVATYEVSPSDVEKQLFLFRFYCSFEERRTRYNEGVPATALAPIAAE